MRTSSVETFQSTMNQCFVTVVENILGRTVKDQILNLLERNGIQRTEISARFDEVVQVLTTSFGECVRVLVFKTVTELYKEYSLNANLCFGESLKDQIALLKQRVVSDLLKPGHSTSIEASINVATRDQEID